MTSRRARERRKQQELLEETWKDQRDKDGDDEEFYLPEQEDDFDSYNPRSEAYGMASA